MESKSRFYANLSHELRTPLMLILNPLERLLSAQDFSPSNRKLVETIHQAGLSLEKIIRQILDIEKLDSGLIQAQYEAVNASSYFKQLLGQFDSLIDANKIQCQWEVQIPEDEYWMMDKEKIRQILHNLLSNALKFVDKEVKVQVGEEGNEYLIRVQDDGPGISSEEPSKIFDRYYQLDQNLKGLGLGLGICKELVEILGGEMGLVSRAGYGSVFRVKIPYERIQKPSVLQADIHTARILIVEDNVRVREYLEEILGEQYRVYSVPNVVEATTFLTELDLVITDLMMQAEDGLALVQKIKSNPETQSIPVVMLTARGEDEIKLTALRIGVDDYLVMPFKEEELKVRINNLLFNYNQRQKLAQKPSADQSWLWEFEMYVSEHYADSTLSVPVLCDRFSMSESTLLRNLKRLTGLSPQQYILEVRLKKAYALLESQAYVSVQQVAVKCGYKDAKSFSRAFKLRYGILPSALL